MGSFGANNPALNLSVAGLPAPNQDKEAEGDCRRPPYTKGGELRHAKAIILFLAVAALVQTSAMAQLGKKSLLPEGQLFLPVGNFSPIENSARIYGEAALATGDLSFVDGTEYDVDADRAAAALDIKVGSAIFSAGFSTATTRFVTTASGVTSEQENERTSIAARGAFRFGDSGIVVLQASQVDEKVTVGASNSSTSISDSAEKGFINTALGASVDISQRFRLGVSFSPEVSDKAEFTGVLAGSETRSGHGAQVAAGLGYNTPTFAAGLELFVESESQDASSQAEQAIIATAELLFGDTSLTGRFVFFQEDPLRIAGELQAPDTEGTIVTVLAKHRFGPVVLGVGISQFNEEGFDTGVPVEDLDRFDSRSITTASLRIAIDF